MAIFFHAEGLNFNLKDKKKIKEWIKYCIKNENKNLKIINYIFVSDNYIIDINKKFLNRNYYTDIITFDYSEEKDISGDIYISIDSVKMNSEIYQYSFENELFRVMIHGALHLVGYLDKTETQKAEMREKEEYYLNKV